MIRKRLVGTVTLAILAVAGIDDALAACRYCSARWGRCQDVVCGNGKKQCGEIYQGGNPPTCYLQGNICVVECGGPPIYTDGIVNYASAPALTSNGHLASAWTPVSSRRLSLDNEDGCLNETD